MELLRMVWTPHSQRCMGFAMRWCESVRGASTSTSASAPASPLKQVRGRTGAPLMECKEALVTCANDIDKAVEWLREHSLVVASMKARRPVTEGLIAAVTHGEAGVLVEVNTETDFAARLESLQRVSVLMGQHILAALSETTSHELSSDEWSSVRLLHPPSDLLPRSMSVQEALVHLVNVTRENVQIRRGTYLHVPEGHVSMYTHRGTFPGTGHMGVLVGLDGPMETRETRERVNEIGVQLGMHILSHQPRFVTASDAKAAQCSVEDALLEQSFLFNESMKVFDVLHETARTLGKKSLTVSSFVKYEVGQSIDGFYSTNQLHGRRCYGTRT